MRRVVSISAAALAVLAGCRVSELDLAPPAPAIALTIGSPELDLPQGLAVLTVANVARSGGFTGNVTFTVDGAPAGMRALVSSPETLDGVTSILVSVGSDRDFPTGTYALTVHAHGDGVADAIAALSVTVKAAGTGVYSLEVRPVSVVQGTQSTVLLSINRADFFDIPVATTAERAPAGVTAAIYPVVNIKALSNLTISVARSVAPGQYLLAIRGMTAGLADRVATLPLTVLAAQP